MLLASFELYRLMSITNGINTFASRDVHLNTKIKHEMKLTS
jgi:hypothetical protein